MDSTRMKCPRPVRWPASVVDAVRAWRPTVATEGQVNIKDSRRLLFVCAGNICRSPLAEAVFAAHAVRRGVRGLFTIDSCGTGGWHAGDDPDPRSIAVARRYGVPIAHRARQLAPRSDFVCFDLLLAMDRENLSEALRAGAPAQRTMLLRQFDPELSGGGRASPEVPDPYYGGPEGFDAVYRMVDRACKGLLDALLAEK